MSDNRESVDISDLKETFLECNVCFDTFDQTDKRPRLLHSCLHAFCTECLERLLVKEGKNQITCPLCRRVEKTKTVKSLPVDPVRNKLVDYLLLRNKKQVLCTESEDNNPAIGRCQECQSYLCKDCDYVHRRHKHSKHHKIISLEKVLEEPIRCLSAKHCCPSHPDHHLEFYCTTDGKLCCLSCTVLEHKGHDLVGLEEAEVEQRTEVDLLLKDVLKKVSAMRKTKQKNIHQQKQMEDTMETSMKDIDAMFDALKLYLDQRKRALMNSIQSQSDKLMTAVQKNTDALDETLAFIESTETYYTEAKEKADTAEMLQLYPTIKRSLEGIDEPESLDNSDEVLSSLTFERIGEDEARKAIAKLGDRNNVPQTLELEWTHYEAMKRFIQAEKLIRECTTEKLRSGKVKVTFSQSKDGEGIKGRVKDFNTDQVEIAKANQSVCKQFFQSTMEELPKVYMQLSDDGETVTIISEDWGEMSAAKKKVQIKFGSHKPKRRSHRHFASSAQQPSASENQSENVDNPRTSDKSDKSLSVGCLDVYIYKANMTTLELDAIVNATNGHLSHGSGLARAISDAAGRDLDDEGRRYVRVNGVIPVTGVVRTTAGNLPSKMVLHAVGPYWSEYQDNEKFKCSEDLCMTVLRCLIEADRYGARDVAIPSISSGIYRVPHAICCAAYVRGVRLFGELCQPRTLKRAHFVDINVGMLTKIQDEFVKCKGQVLHATEQEKKFIKRYINSHKL